MSKLLGALSVLVIVGFVISVVVIARQPVETSKSSSIALPTDNRQKELPGGYLYASNEDLSELLPNVDLFFKLQGLRSDRQGEMFEYPENSKSGESAALQDCIEFKYFEWDTNKATVTLIPQDPSCFIDDQGIQGEIGALFDSYRYVYAVETPNQ